MESKDQGESWRRRAVLDLKLHYKLAHQFRLSLRLIRGGIQSLTTLSDGSLVGITRKAIIHLDKNERLFKTVFPILEGSRPRNICKGPDEKLYFGEYFANPQRREVHIYGSDDGGRHWEPVYTFPEKSIKHIHQIKYDPFRKCYWVVTGDFGHEPKIGFTDDDFRTFNIVAEGTQSVRAAGIVCTPEGLFYGTDTQFEQNYLMFLDVNAGKADRIFELEGSSLYINQAGPWIFVSSAIEPSKVNHSPFATLWAFKNGEEPNLLARWKRDCWDLRYFQFAAFKCPDVENSESLRSYATFTTGIAGHDQRTQIWQW